MRRRYCRHRSYEPLGRCGGQATRPTLHLPGREVDDRLRLPHPARLAARRRGRHALSQLRDDGLRRAQLHLRADGPVGDEPLHGGPRLRGRAHGERRRRRSRQPPHGELPQGLEPSRQAGAPRARRLRRFPHGGVSRRAWRVRLFPGLSDAGIRPPPAFCDNADGRGAGRRPDIRRQDLRPLHGVRQKLPRQVHLAYGDREEDDMRGGGRMGQARRNGLFQGLPRGRAQPRAFAFRRQLSAQVRLRPRARG